MNEYEILDEVGQGMVDLRSKILYTVGVRNAYFGYAKAQRERVLREYPNHKPKMARHCLRIARQATELLTTGECNVMVNNPQEYFEFTELPFDDMDAILSEAVNSIETCESVLPEHADIIALDEFLKEVRRNYVG
jgi:hypothetical protein